ncbi:hypothetical protein NIB75_22110 [Bacteroides uniformis]|nr:hypothetical protein [Bacteroides uniformis]
MTLDFGASYILQNDQNMTNQGTYNNPLVGAYLFPRSNDWSDISMYERYDAARKIYTQYWPVGDEGMVMQNPYWINYRNLRQNKKDRYMLNAGLSYKILDWLTVSDVYVWITPTMIIQKSSMLLPIHSSPRALHEVFMVLPRCRTNSCMQTSW